MAGMSKDQLKLIEDKAKANALISECRQQIDSAARGERFGELGQAAKNLVIYAKQAEDAKRALDAILDEAWKQRKG
jgi:hypothetical protein